MPAIIERDGLTVKWQEAVWPRNAKRSAYKRASQAKPLSLEGWYIVAESSEGPHVVAELRFARQQDASMAAETLTRAGYTNVRKMNMVRGEEILRIAFESLQW